MSTGERIRKLQHFAGRWMLWTGLLILLLLAIASWNLIFPKPNIPDAFADMLWVSISGGIWSLFDVHKLKRTTDIRRELNTVHTNLRIRRIAWGVLFTGGLCLAVFSSVFKWPENWLFAGIGLTLPSAIFFLAELGLALQIGWTGPTQNRNF